MKAVSFVHQLYYFSFLLLCIAIFIPYFFPSESTGYLLSFITMSSSSSSAEETESSQQINNNPSASSTSSFSSSTNTVSVPSFTLLNGNTMPVIGLGTWRANDEASLYTAVLEAIKTGYRHFDCAALYFNEHIIGKALKDAIDQGLVTRAELFLTSKLMPTEIHTHTAIPALQRTLQALQTSYLDLYLLHWPTRFVEKPSSFPVPFNERLGYNPDEIAKVWQVLENEAVDTGLVKSLGVSNFSIKKVQNLLTIARYLPVNNQVEMHPALQQSKLLNWHKEKQIIITTYCPLGSPSRPPTFRHGDTDPDILTSPILTSIATKYNATPAQITLRWAIQRGTVPLPKSVTPSRIVENIQCLRLPNLSTEDMNLITGMDQHYRFSRGDSFITKEQTWKDLWDEEEE